ncbi:MAG TPA: hypothetical protein VIS06_15840 [Mycobacteriales bacterium]
MRVTFLGSDSQNGGSPTLFATDRGTLVVRGYVITDEEALGDLGDVPAGEVDVEIPAELLRFHAEPMVDDPRYVAPPDDGVGGRR